MAILPCSVEELLRFKDRDDNRKEHMKTMTEIIELTNTEFGQIYQNKEFFLGECPANKASILSLNAVF